MTGGRSDRDTCRFLEKSGMRKLLKRERLIEESRLWNASVSIFHKTTTVFIGNKQR